MTNANAASASDASFDSPAQQPVKPPSVSAQQMSDLLRRYPDINAAEKLELVNFLKRGHPDTLAMVTFGSGLVSQVGKVKKDHPEQFAAGWRTLLPWVGFLVVVVALIMLARVL